MGQTLTHGIYLPDEGERNCYNGLAANWQLLDGAVGTVAEHTTQIAGKASASHTHGKADITDLFNSANTWTGTNSFNIGNLEVQTEYTLGTLPQAEDAQALLSGHTTDNNFVTGIYFYQSPTRGTGVRFTIRNKWDSTGYSTTGTTRNAHFELLQSINKTAYMQWEGYVNNGLYPLANNSYDLGSSSYQWNNLYAKNYFYNGTAWGLDQANTWTNTNTFTAYVESIGSSAGDEYSANTRTNLWLMGNRDTKKVSGILFDTYRQNTAQGTGIHILGISIKENSVRYEGCRWGWYWDNNLNGYTFDFKPTTQGANQALKHNLGTSVDKWDTLNGVNPGALSLPNVNAVTGSSNTQLQDISGDLVQDQYGNCYFTPRMDGWAYIALDCSNATIHSGCSSYSVSAKTARSFANALYTQPFTKNENAWTQLGILFPVTVNKEITLELTFTGFSVIKAYVIPAQGNV